jgi:hypothetical protein
MCVVHARAHTQTHYVHTNTHAHTYTGVVPDVFPRTFESVVELSIMYPKWVRSAVDLRNPFSFGDTPAKGVGVLECGSSITPTQVSYFMQSLCLYGIWHWLECMWQFDDTYTTELFRAILMLVCWCLATSNSCIHTFIHHAYIHACYISLTESKTDPRYHLLHTFMHTCIHTSCIHACCIPLHRAKTDPRYHLLLNRTPFILSF